MQYLIDRDKLPDALTKLSRKNPGPRPADNDLAAMRGAIIPKNAAAHRRLDAGR